MSFYQDLLSRIRLVRRNWRLQALVKGLGFFLVSAVGLILFGIWGADLFGFKPAAVWTMRVLTGAMAAYVALRFLWLPLRRRISNVQVAQYIEERYPQLEDRLVTAVEYGAGNQISPGILDLLIRDALQKIRLVDFRVFLNRKRSASYAALAAGAVLGLLALLNWGPSFLPYGFDRLYAPWLQAADKTSLMIEVRPGSIELTQGSDQEIEARLIGFDSPEVRLLVRPEGKTSSERLPMEAEQQGNRFLYLMLDIQSSLHYRVEAGGIRSPDYTISVLGLGRVDKIDATYDFPAYTGMPSQTVENEGDLSAIQGTKVSLKIHINKPAASARLLFEDQSTLALNPSGDLVFAGAVTLQRSGSYVVQLSDGRGKLYVGSKEYQIEVIEDEPPRVTITKPLRDVRATNVEEVFTEVSSEDDIGLGKVQLHFSVNGNPEKVVDLYKGKPPEKAVVSAHTFFLEDFGLQPGDLVSYYAKATDGNNVTGPGMTSSDIYFIQIRPFENRYRQSQEAALPGGEGGGGSGRSESLSRQQKEIVAATFKLIRDKETMEAKEYADSLSALALVQSRLQVQAQSIVDRLTRRGASAASEDFAKLTDYIKAAIEEMQKAAVLLGSRKPVEALPEEQKALQQLLRAESLFREIQVTFSTQGGGGGGGGGSRADAEDLADLFELELNKLKNQYETVQRGERQQRDQKLDEAMERLKELAQRQQQLNERNRMLRQRGGSAGASSSGGEQGQRQLMDEAEKLARQLQRLSRERNSAELSRVSSRLEQAIQEMRRGLENQQAGRDTSGQGMRALQRLEDARRALSRGQNAGLIQGLEDAVQESKELVQEQDRIQAGIDRMIQEREGPGKAESRQPAEELATRKEVLAGRLKNLQSTIQDLARLARKPQPETSSKLTDAAGAIRDKKLPERILSGGRMLQGGSLEALKGLEGYIRAGLDELNRRLEDAKNSVGQTREGKLVDAMDKIRQLADGLESMRQRLQGLERGPQMGGQRPQSGEAARREAQSSGQGQVSESGRQGSQAGQASNTQGGGNQRGGEPGGRPGREAVRGLTANSGGPPSGVGPYTDEEFRQLSREAQQRLMDAGELRRLLDRNSAQMQNLEDVIEKLRSLDDVRQYADPEESARLREAIDLLRQLEIDLGRELSKLTQKDQFLHADDNEAPAGYRRLVEEYYKALARVRPK